MSTGYAMMPLKRTSAGARQLAIQSARAVLDETRRGPGTDGAPAPILRDAREPGVTMSLSAP